jgi:FixJ family two-component response regulator
MNEVEGTVYLIDDDEGMLRALTRVLKVAKLNAVTFSSGRDFLKQKVLASPACLVVDVCMPGLNGLELQQEMARRNMLIPTIFMTGHGTIPMSVQAMKAGAVDFLEKPFDNRELLRLIRLALARDSAQAGSKAECAALRKRLATLTPRERDVLMLVIRGLLNKQIAAELGTTELTIKVHRHRVMRKMEVESVAELVQSAIKIGLLGI